MKKLLYLLFACVGTLFAACSSNEQYLDWDEFVSQFENDSILGYYDSLVTYGATEAVCNLVEVENKKMHYDTNFCLCNGKYKLGEYVYVSSEGETLRCNLSPFACTEFITLYSVVRPTPIVKADPFIVGGICELQATSFLDMVRECMMMEEAAGRQMNEMHNQGLLTNENMVIWLMRDLVEKSDDCRYWRTHNVEFNSVGMDNSFEVKVSPNPSTESRSFMLFPSVTYNNMNYFENQYYFGIIQEGRN